MAKIIDGELTGILGDLVAYRGKRPGLRKRPVRKKPYSEKERENQYIFGMVSSWIRPISAFVRVTLTDHARLKLGQSTAVSKIFRSALVRNGYNSVINPAMVQVSEGPVRLPSSLTISKIENRQVAFEWSTEIDYSSHPRDPIMILAYNIESKEATWTFSGPPRKEAAAVLDLSSMVVGDYHIWVVFKSYGEELYSNSEYMGSIAISNRL